MTRRRILDARSIRLSGTASTRQGAIQEVGGLLVEAGSVQPSYVKSMIERDAAVSTYMGNYLAIPHGTNASKETVIRSALAVVRYSEPVDWNGHEVRFVLGIAGAGREHLAILAKVADVFCDDAQVRQLLVATTVEEMLALLDGVDSL